MRHPLRLLPVVVVGMLLTFIQSARAQMPYTKPLDALADLDRIEQDWGEPRVNKSVDGKPLTIAGKVYEHGLGTHARSRIVLDVAGGDLNTDVGVDDDDKAGKGSVVFRVSFNGKPLWDSGVMRGGDAAKTCHVQIPGQGRLVLEVDDAGDGIDSDHADWAGTYFVYFSTAPKIHVPTSAPPYILTPKPPPEPRINGAKIFGVRPSHPFMYTIAATGERPMKFAADGLPDGLSLDPQTGLIIGTLKDRGEHKVTLHATNARGTADRDLRIVVGDRIALTPPMGWNSWNCWAEAVSDDKVRAAADAMTSSGLIEHGWTYVNIDDCWEIKPSAMDKDPVQAGPQRDADGRIRTNKKFPDMRALAEYVHGKGLRIGLYSSPGPLTCGGYTASYKFEPQDAQSYADWGFDYLKYDWCSYGGIADEIRKNRGPGSGSRVPENAGDASSPEPGPRSPDPERQILQHPYHVMRSALDKVDRDIVFSLCQYGMGNVWEWGDQVGGNCWRTTGDIVDSWRSMSTIGFGQASHEKFAGPGHWNDPDMLVVGQVGWGPKLHPSRLSADEQYTHISLWCLLSAPLLIGCDMTKLDDFTRSLLTNDEVIAVNQDPLGKQAARVAKDGDLEVWAKDMEDGSKAVGLFNRGDAPAEVTATWSTLGITGERAVRDLWRQQDVARASDQYKATVPSHGVVLVKLAPAS